MASQTNTTRASHAHKIDVGTLPNNFPEWESTEVRFHGFSELSTERYIESQEFTCLGHQWRLRLYPGGDPRSDEGMVGIFLHYLSNDEVIVKYTITCGEFGEQRGMRSNEVTIFSSSSGSHGSSNFAGYSTIAQNLLLEDTFVIQVRMKLIGSTSKTPLPFIPKNPLSNNILKKFMDETTADVVFEVSCESKGAEGSQKRAKISPAIFHAHRLILMDCAPTLAELCKIEGGMTPVKITNVKPDMFRHMLYYVYGGTVPNEDLKSHAKDIIDAADKFGVVNLKLEAEACYVQSGTITMDNVIDDLLYADSKNCALLKEAVMDFLVENGGEAAEQLSFENVPSYMMKDLLTAVNMGKQQAKNDARDYSTTRVSTLRNMLHEKGLDVDGSREAMIALIKENS